MKNEYIKSAYKFVEAEQWFFDNFNKELVLELYTDLDYLYSLLESIGVVDIYSKHELLEDFEVISIYSDFFLKNSATEVYSKRVDIEKIMHAIFNHFTNVN